MKVSIRQLRRIIKEELTEAWQPRYRNIHFDSETGQIVDRNYGPVRDTEGAQDWDRTQMKKWAQDNGVESVTLSDPRGREKEVSLKNYLSRGKVVPVVKGTPTSVPAANEREPEQLPAGHYRR